MKRNVPTYDDWRNFALAFDAEKSGMSPIGTNGIFGLVMDIGFPEGWATVVVFADGSASLYLSGGGGVIGGGGHESVKKTAIKMVEVADQNFHLTEATTSTPLPTEGDVTFYLLTKKGIRKANAKEQDLGEQRHALSSLFYAGQDAITQLREISNNSK